MRTIVVLGLCSLAISILAADFGSKDLSARPAPGKVAVDYKSQESVTLHEPVVVTFSVRNGSMPREGNVEAFAIAVASIY